MGYRSWTERTDGCTQGREHGLLVIGCSGSDGPSETDADVDEHECDASDGGHAVTCQNLEVGRCKIYGQIEESPNAEHVGKPSADYKPDYTHVYSAADSARIADIGIKLLRPYDLAALSIFHTLHAIIALQ